MTDAVSTSPDKKEATLEWLSAAFAIFLRLLSAVFLIFTLMTWSLAIGFLDGPEVRFDTMTVKMRTYVAVLAVLHPVACVGLWTTLPWGRVVWFMAVAFQLGFIFANPEGAGDPKLISIFHMACVGIYVVFQLMMHRVANKE